jgi:hypothetical protein
MGLNDEQECARHLLSNIGHTHISSAQFPVRRPTGTRIEGAAASQMEEGN